MNRKEFDNYQSSARTGLPLFALLLVIGSGNLFIDLFPADPLFVFLILWAFGIVGFASSTIILTSELVEVNKNV